MNTQQVSPRQAWAPIPESAWNEEYARHLLRRIGFSATPDAVHDSVMRGLRGTLAHYFGTLRNTDKPASMLELEEQRPLINAARRQAESPEESQELGRRLRALDMRAYNDHGLHWLAFAAEPEHSPQEKWVLFLQNVLVTGRNGVYMSEALWDYQDLLRRNAYGSYPDLIKAVTRSVAMIRYLDLNRSNRNAPNENFARELFELFTLGEGHYTEADIKEAARAFTGYRHGANGFQISRQQHDDGAKKVFGRSGRWRGDDIIDLTFRQPAAREFLPRECVRHYVTDGELPDDYYRELGAIWAASDFNLRVLQETIFRSQLFYAEGIRGTLIKSPIHYYLGLCQDLRLDPSPFPGRSLNLLRSMGQAFFDPPNVLGWPGGRLWINSTTLSARRQLVEQLFVPLDSQRLNADDQIRLEEALRIGRGELFVRPERLQQIAKQDPEETVNHFCAYFLPTVTTQAYREPLIQHLSQGQGSVQRRTGDVIIAILKSPDYQLC